jgi:hypothetical protein
LEKNERMKKGKTAKISGFKASKVSYGTVDSKNLKSIYINIQTWVEPKDEFDNWTRIVLNMSRAVKHVVFNCVDKELFDDKFIVDLDLRTSGIHHKKRSFMNLEINLFLFEEMDFKSQILKKSVKDIVNCIHSDIFKGNEYFNFYISKKDKTEFVEV